jgi:D-3-phosphoglycerate dehydrogenase
MENRGIRIVAVSDLCISEEMYHEAFGKLIASGAQLRVVDWKVRNLKDWRENILKIEKQGPTAVAYPLGLEKAVADVDVLITHVCPIPQKVLNAANRLRALGCARSGLENVDVQTARNKGIAILYCPASKISTAADTTVGLMLAESRGIARTHSKMMRGIWDASSAFFGNSTGLTGKKIGLVGFGNIGQAIANRLKGFDVQLLVHDPYQSENIIRKYMGEPVELPKLLRTADFVVVMARLDRNQHTKPIIGKAELEMMKETAFFINTARAGLVDYMALREILENKRIAGAALDVFDHEPLLRTDPFLKLDNVTLSPHIAGVSKEGYFRSAQDIAENVELLMSGQCPKFVLNPEVIYKAGASSSAV